MSKTSTSSQRRSLLLPNQPRWTTEQGPIISLKNICKSFPPKTIFENINLDIEVGKTTVIIGQSGSGKSLLLKMINGLISPDKGEVTLFGQNIASLNTHELNELRKRTGMVLQDYALIDSLNLLENVAFPLTENTKLNKDEIFQRVKDTLEPLGLADAIYKFPQELSGGMKKRVSFARAIIHEPELVLFDEPTTGLDPVMIEFVDSLIQDMNKRYDITSVIVSHDLQSIQRLANNIAMIHNAKIYFQGTPQDAFNNNDPVLEAFLKPSRTAQKNISDNKPKPIVSVRNLHKAFDGKKVLTGVDLDIYEKQITVLIGGSGSGKSVLLKHILGLFYPDQGDIYVDNLHLNKCSQKELEHMRTTIGMLFQGAALFDSMSVYENIAFPLAERPKPLSSKIIKQKVDEMLERLKLTSITNAFPAAISAGQKKRVALARAIITKPKIMIYDEPTTGQDPVMIHYVDDMIVEAHREFNLTTIVISHDMGSTFKIADKIAMLYQGQIVADDSPQKLMISTNPNVQKFIAAGGMH